MSGSSDRPVCLANLGRLMVERYDVDFVDDLVSDDPEIAEHGAQEFGDIVYHQDDIYLHSLAAIDDMVAALDIVSPRAQEHFIFMIGGIATAGRVVDGDNSMIADASRKVFGYWDSLAEFLTHEDPGVRIAALVVLTDLLRLQLPGAALPSPAPVYVGALPDGLDPVALREAFENAIAESAPRLDEEWSANCDYARACLALPTIPEPTSALVHRDWGVLYRHGN